jgi:hypothetical protein
MFHKHMFSERADLRVSVQKNQWFPDGPRDGFLERMVVVTRRRRCDMTRLLTAADFPETDFCTASLRFVP